MTAVKPSETATARPSPPPGQTSGRRAWKKKTPVEVFVEQEEKLRKEITETEKDLNQKRLQLKKFEEARKIIEGT